MAESNTSPGTPFHNPIISGFHPDPSICRVGDDYYLVHSTFEYSPGVPIYHSRDLAHWNLIGHCLTRPSQLPLKDAASSAGIYAPVIRHHAGVFYMITTNVSGGGHFIVTAPGPAGPWSEPMWIGGDGVDPSLFFDEDGKVYFTREGEGEKGGIFQAEIDLKTGLFKEEPRLVWRGTGGAWPEGPHLFKRGGWYYLMIAEGGTGYEHHVTIARSKSPMGSFDPCPRNPILTHMDEPENPVHAVGHADFVETADGDWYLVCLGIRPKGGRFNHLGRETFLAPVKWDSDGWPVVNGNGRLPKRGVVVGLRSHPFKSIPIREEFKNPRLGPDWIFLRNPDPMSWAVESPPGRLRLWGNAATLDDTGAPAFVGRRQEHFECRLATRLAFHPAEQKQEAGLTLRANEKFRYDMAVVKHGKGVRAIARALKAGVERELGHADFAAGSLDLIVQAHGEKYEFFVGMPGVEPLLLGSGPTKDLSTEIAGGFTGAVIGLYATSRGTGQMPPADFEWFDYEPKD